VTAVRLDLEMDGFHYRKWGAEQRCKRGDWLVDNDGDVYTIDAAVFARTYRPVSPGRYVKITRVWARQAHSTGRIRTNEGETRYQAGDYLVYNNPDGSDGYAVTADKFNARYEPDDD
jgi:hypothetical protein